VRIIFGEQAGQCGIEAPGEIDRQIESNLALRATVDMDDKMLECHGIAPSPRGDDPRRRNVEDGEPPIQHQCTWLHQEFFRVMMK
jgi:hypothetical protein